MEQRINRAGNSAGPEKVISGSCVSGITRSGEKNRRVSAAQRIRTLAAPRRNSYVPTNIYGGVGGAGSLSALRNRGMVIFGP